MNYSEKWARNMRALQAFVAENGHTDVPSAYSTQDEKGHIFLGPWVSKTRSHYRKGSLLPHRIRELEDIPGWSWEASRPGPRVAADRDLDIIAMGDAGASTREIAAKHNLTPQRVNQILRKDKS